MDGFQRLPLIRATDDQQPGTAVLQHQADVVGPVLFFCSPASDFITGQILYVDGGITASQ